MSTDRSDLRTADAVLFGLLLILGAACGSLLALGRSGADLSGLGALASTAGDEWLATVTNPWYAGFLVVLLVLQWAWPARRDLPGANVGLGQDAVWFVLNTALAVTVVAGWLAVLEVAYTDLAGGWSLDLGDELGSWGLPVTALVVTDLMAWTSHYLHHKVPALWAFHAVHHSQEEMNVLSDSRQHVIETMITATMVFVPARVLGLDAPAASGLAFLSIYVGAFIHANIRTNLGPARFLLNSPQAHRVHHSAAAEHIDTNFAVILAPWDYLFGTRYADDHEYPTTGIHDRTFPLEHRADPASLATTWARQMAYPFRHLAARHSSALEEARVA
jgi:sterol desaturase/sphingolipid hydroxylase (fatty acid hydroxylase superfamily)